MDKAIKKLAEGRKSYLFPLFLISLTAGLVLFLSYGYMDLKAWTVLSLNLWDCLFDGNLWNYYEYCAENIYHLECEYMGANYLALIPWAVWNLPIWILQRYFGVVAVGHAWTLLYSKIFLLFVHAASLYYTYKIVRIVKPGGQGAETVYLSLSFPFAMIAVYYAGQTDIISICLFVIAIYHLLNGNRKLFLLFSVCSIAAKPYVLIPFAAVVLLTEKNIWKIIRDAAAGISVMALFHICYLRAPMYLESLRRGPSAKQMDSLLGLSVSNFLGMNISLFLVAVICTYFYFYIHPWKEKSPKTLIYAVIIPILLFFLFTEYKFYRVVYLFPFLYILFAVNTDRLVYNLLLECIMNAGIAVKFYLTNGGFFSNWFVFDFVRKLIPRTGQWLRGIRGIKENVMLYDNPVYTVVSSVIFAVFVLILLINSPKYKPVNGGGSEKLNKKAILYIRSSLLFILILLSFYRS